MPHDDELDGCEADFAALAVPDEVADLLPLFPDGVASEAAAEAWRQIAAGALDGP